MSERVFAHWPVIVGIFSEWHCVSWQTRVTPISFGNAISPRVRLPGAAEEENRGERRDGRPEGGREGGM